MLAQYRFRGLSAKTRRILERQGESSRFEFKQTAEAVSPKVLVAAANDSTKEPVTILVGVEEEKDEITGVVTGRVVGLEDVERGRGLIQSRANDTYPTPVRATLYEENLKTNRPILRVEVSADLKPHFTKDGTRATRSGASTRGLMDEELIAIYLDREAEAFERRFAGTAELLFRTLDHVTDAVDDLDDRLHKILDSLTDIHSEFVERLDEAKDHMDLLEDGIRVLHDPLYEDLRLGIDQLYERLGQMKPAGH